MSSDEKYISLLKFALQKKHIPKDRYCIGALGDEKKVDDSLCLLKDGSQWIVAYSERGIVSEKSAHSSLRIALKDFYARLAVDENPWSFRREWEKETGNSL